MQKRGTFISSLSKGFAAKRDEMVRTEVNDIVNLDIYFDNL